MTRIECNETELFQFVTFIVFSGRSVKDRESREGDII
jgi:hypothetical protein